MTRLFFLLLVLTLPSVSAADAGTSAPAPAEEQRAELLERIEDLQRRVPKDLRTDLMIISMKLSTGYCSPYRVQEFEDALDALPESKQRRFSKELAAVQSHPMWPSVEEAEAQQ